MTQPCTTFLFAGAWGWSALFSFSAPLGTFAAAAKVCQVVTGWPCRRNGARRFGIPGLREADLFERRNGSPGAPNTGGSFPRPWARLNPHDGDNLCGRRKG